MDNNRQTKPRFTDVSCCVWTLILKQLKLSGDNKIQLIRHNTSSCRFDGVNKGQPIDKYKKQITRFYLAYVKGCWEITPHKWFSLQRRCSKQQRSRRCWTVTWCPTAENQRGCTRSPEKLPSKCSQPEVSGKKDSFFKFFGCIPKELFKKDFSLSHWKQRLHHLTSSSFKLRGKSVS